MNQFVNSYNELWKQLGPNQRVSIIVSALMVIAGAMAMFVWTQRPNMSLLYGSVSGKDAASIVGYLEEQGIDYEIRAGGSSIFVPREQVYKVRMDVVSQGLVSGDATGFEIFDRTTFGISDFIQRTNFIRAIQGELARTITQLRGVQSARVMVVMPENRLLIVNDAMETTASVFVDIGASSLDEEAVRSIQALVANAVLGLTTHNVAVIDNNGNVLSKESKEDDIMAAGSSLVEYRQSLESYFGNKVESMLETVVGPGNVVVRVATEINASQTTVVDEDFNDAGGVLRQQTTREQVRSEVSNDSATGAEGEEGGGAQETTSSRSGDESLDREQRYEIDRKVTNRIEAPGGITRISASVFVAMRTDPEDPTVTIPRSEEELTDLQQMVANALGIPTDAPEFGNVAVQETLFSQGAALPPELLEGGGFDLSMIMNYADEMVDGLVAIVILLVFLTILKRARSERTLLDRMQDIRVDAQSQVDVLGQQTLTPELLNELIRQKPDNVSTNLRKWLGAGSDK